MNPNVSSKFEQTTCALWLAILSKQRKSSRKLGFADRNRKRKMSSDEGKNPKRVTRFISEAVSGVALVS